MRGALNGENLKTIEDFSAWANEIKKEVNAKKLSTISFTKKILRNLLKTGLI